MNINRTSKFIIRSLLLSFSVLLSGCSLMQSKTPTVKVFKSLESVQCEKGGFTLAAVTQQLSAAGVHIVNSSCGSDGQIHAAMCGVSDGRIAIIEVTQKDLKAALSLGFSPLESLRYAHQISCE